MGRQGRRAKQLLDDRKERRGYWKFNSFQKRLWTFRKTDCRMNEYICIVTFFLFY